MLGTIRHSAEGAFIMQIGENTAEAARQARLAAVNASAVVRAAAQDLVVLGDSITAWNWTDAANNVHSDSWATHLALGLAGKLHLIRNAGIGGNTTAQMLARFDSDVMAYLPDGGWVGIAGGTNDPDGVTDTYPNVEAMINRAHNGGCKVFLCSNITNGCPALAAPTVTATGAITGGTLAAGSYSYRVAALNDVGTTLASTAAGATVASGTTGSVVISWPHIQGARSYKIYGRIGGSELLIATNTLTTAGCRYVDTGSVTPSGALPGANTTASARNSAAHLKHGRVRNSLMRLARKYGLPLIDFHTMNADPAASGIFLAGASVDGTHPANKNQRLMGVEGSLKLAPYLPPTAFVWTLDNAYPSGLTANALLLNNDGSKPAGWTVSLGSSAMATVAGINGSAIQVSSASGAAQYLYSPEYAAFSVGDKLAFYGKLNFSGADAAYGRASIAAKFQQVVTPRFVGKLDLNADTNGVVPFYFEGTVPVGGLSLIIEVALTLAGSAAGGTVTLSAGQLDIVNLTALGLA